MIIKKYLSVIWWGAAALILSAGGSFAQQQTVKVPHGGTYFEYGAGVMFFDVPELNGYSTAITTGGRLKNFIRQPHDPFDFDSTAATGFLRLGHKIFDKTWVEVSFQAARSTVNSSLGSQTLGGGEFNNIFLIENGFQAPAQFIPGDTVTGQVNSSLKYHDSSFLVRRQYDVGSVQITPLAGFSYTQLDTKIILNEVNPGKTYTLNETMETSFLGIVLGAGLNWQFGPLTRVYGDIRASAIFSDSDFQGRQLWNGGTLSQANDEDDKTGFRGGAMVGVETGVKTGVLGHVLIGLEARVDHWTHVPKIVNPQLGPGENFFAVGPLTPAHIGYGHMTNVSIAAHVTLPFGN